VVLRCIYCLRLTRFLAADLKGLLCPGRDAQALPFGCSRCGRDDYLSVTLHLPEPGITGI
jgi:hypothetical protein